MGWLDRWRETPKEETQLGLFGQEQALVPHHRVDGATANQALQNEVKQRGGTQKTHRAVNVVITRNTLGCTPDELYAETGGQPGKRNTLPKEAQEALFMGDVAARHEIANSDAQGHQEIVQASDRGSQKARKLFPW